VPRVQAEEGVTYIFLRMPQNDGERFVTVPVLLAVGSSFLLTVWGTRPTFMEKYLDGRIAYSTDRRSQLILKLWQDINVMYQAALTEISRRVRATMADLGAVQNRDILRLVTSEGVLNDFLAALMPMHSHMGALVSGKHIKTYDEDSDLYEDVLLQSGQVIEYTKSVLKTTVNFRDAYSVIVNNNLNRIVKFLTAATVILAIPTAVFSFYGMNVRLPIDAHPFAAHIILISTVVLSLVLVIIFSRRQWL
jgi:magnesium transporter